MRLKYIDGLRGFTMFLVVFWHVMSLWFDCRDSLLGAFFRTFRMPMFFFISGFIGYKALASFTSDNYLKLLKHKAFVQLGPTAIIYVFYCFVMGVNPMKIFHEGLAGYWFTLALFELFLLFYTISLVCAHVGKSKLQNIILAVIILFAWIPGLYIAHLQDAAPRLVKVCSIGHVCSYMPYFCTGLVVRKYQDRSINFITNKYTYAACFSLFAIGFLAVNTVIDNKYLHYILLNYLLPFCGLVSVFNIFYHSSDFFNSDCRISKAMQFVGSRTLDIYLLHYFFLIDLSAYKDFFVQGGKEFVLGEILVMGTIALATIGVCLLISSSLRKSEILAKYLFGIVPKKAKIQK